MRYADQLPEPVEAMIVRLKKGKPHWGAGKIWELLMPYLSQAPPVKSALPWRMTC
ncbi:Mobile element protein [Rhizobium freirei PRF 81]|uniref:Mobile element protein n=1 Tax=Rhizobium freirei PRF 81 TaxID=363754 RepID=N6UVY7_9HYPH|nr:Mobile element protein [Rhizobium freirei PRF 81]